jgi:hypothetical protein
MSEENVELGSARVEAFRRELLPDDFDRRLLEWRSGGAARH